MNRARLLKNFNRIKIKLINKKIVKNVQDYKNKLKNKNIIYKKKYYFYKNI